MSDDDQPNEQQDDPAEEPDEQPDLDDDDYVDIPEEMDEQVAQETTDKTDSDGGDDGDESGDTESVDPLTSGTSVGDVYCNALGMAATLARESKGSGVDDREQQVDEYAEMAKQLDLDEFVNEWVEQHGGTDDLSPGQGIVVGSTMFLVMVMVEDPSVAEGIAEGVQADA